MASILDGVRVLEVAQFAAAPAAAAMLADMGAQVIKVEPPLRGDAIRGYLGFMGGIQPTDVKLNYAHELENRGKKSVGVDISRPEGREVVCRLVKSVDVMVTNLLPKRQEKYRLRYEDLLPLNPRLVYLAVTGYGMLGLERDRPGFDYAAFWAHSGIMDTIGEAGCPPTMQRPGMGDHITSIAGLAGVLAALYERERSGVGQLVDCSLAGTAPWVLSLDISATLLTRRGLPKGSRKEVGNPLFNCYQAADGRWIQVVMIQSELYWAPFCRALGREDLLRDERFQTHQDRWRYNKELIRILDETFATRTLEEWDPRLDAEGVIWAPVHTLDEVIEDPQLRANDAFFPLHHPNLGAYEVVGIPMKFGRTPARPQGPAPELGQHTEQVLLEAGYSWEQIAALKDAGVIT